MLPHTALPIEHAACCRTLLYLLEDNVIAMYTHIEVVVDFPSFAQKVGVSYLGFSCMRFYFYSFVLESSGGLKRTI